MKFFKFFLFIVLCNLIFADSSGFQKYYSNINKAAKNHEWWDVISNSKLFLDQYPQEARRSEVIFFLGEAYFHVNELELADQTFSKYLSIEFSPKFYDEAVTYKFKIAKKFYDGARKHFLGSKKMPKILPAREDALKIFEEVLTALPNSDLAIEALYYKGKIHTLMEDYKDGLDAFQTLIRKYPKHEFAIESFLEIGKIYLRQADPKRQDPNLLDLTSINLKKFKETFPKEERVLEAEEDYKKLQEIYASGLYEIGAFYERTKRKEASKLYYQKIIFNFPDSPSADLSKKRLAKLEKIK